MEAAEVQGLRVAHGANVVIRAVRADDAPMLQAFVRRLSARSRRFRFFSGLVELPAAQLDRLTRPDREGLALVALSGRLQDTAIVGEARYVVDPTAVRDAEFAIAIADEFQRQGLGKRLMKHIFAHASGRGVQRLFGEIMADNSTMLEFVRRLGFRIRGNDSDRRTMIACIPVGAMTTMAEW